MAENVDFDRGAVFVGEDTVLSFARASGSDDPSGWDLELVARVPIRSNGDGTLIATLTKTDGDGITVDGTTINVAIDSADTEDEDEQAVEYTLRRTDVGSQRVLAYGRLFLTAPARRPAVP